MNISSTGAVSPQYPAGTSASPKAGKDGDSDTEQQIKKLEKEKSGLEKQRDDAKNPFAAQQSEEYEALEKKIQELDKQIQQLKAEASSNQKNTDTQDSDVSSASRSFDTYTPSSEKPENSAGVYRLEKDETGKQKIVFNRNGVEREQEADDEEKLVAHAEPKPYDGRNSTTAASAS